VVFRAAYRMMTVLMMMCSISTACGRERRGRWHDSSYLKKRGREAKAKPRAETEAKPRGQTIRSLQKDVKLVLAVAVENRATSKRKGR